MVTLLLIANIVNLGADLSAMGAALGSAHRRPMQLYTLLFGVVCILLEIALSYPRYAAVLKWTTLSLFAYVAVVVVAHVPWGRRCTARLSRSCIGRAYATAMVAILGTTISPYLFFWQAGQEIEEQHRHHAKPLCITPREAGPELERIRTDTLVGMGVSNLDRLAGIVFATAATLNANGITDIPTSAQAAEALRPVAGPFHLRDVRARDHRHRPARRAGARRLGRLCGDRDGRLDRRPRRRRSRRKRSTPRSRLTTLGGAALNFSRSIRSGRSTGRRWSTACWRRRSWR